MKRSRVSTCRPQPALGVDLDPGDRLALVRSSGRPHLHFSGAAETVQGSIREAADIRLASGRIDADALREHPLAGELERVNS